MVFSVASTHERSVLKSLSKQCAEGFRDSVNRHKFDARYFNVEAFHALLGQ